MNLEKEVATVLIEFYRANHPALINAVCALKEAGQTPEQIEAEMKKKGTPEKTTAELYLIAKHLEVLGKDFSN